MFTVAELRRYPVKSMGGESLPTAEIDTRGLVGDRRYAVVDADGRFASGKSTRRFKRRDEIFAYAATTDGDRVRVTGGDGSWVVGDPALDAALTDAMGAAVHVLPENGVPHFDAGAVSLIGTATLDWCREHFDVDAESRRLRANVVIVTDEPFVEETWIGRGLKLGPVGLTVVERIERCRTIDLAQDGVATTTRWLTALAGPRDLKLGIYADVAQTGTISAGDTVS
ncbi:MAG: MOSC domain-containing protein [Nocardioides sp.]